MARKQKIVVGNTNSELWSVYIGRQCIVLKNFFYNGEGWYRLRDINTSEVFESPDIFWSETN